MKTTMRKNKPTLAQQVALLRSAVIGLVGRDPEGEYRPEFVESMFQALSEKPTLRYSTSKQFLADLRRA